MEKTKAVMLYKKCLFFLTYPRGGFRLYVLCFKYIAEL